MAIWTVTPNLEYMAEASKNTAVSHMGIEYLEIGDDYVKGRMPVDQRTVQPFGILHGGSSVGLDINANHIRPVTGGWVYGTARAQHIGSTTQVWEIRLENEQGKLTCISRLTMAVTRRTA
jgi:acyl-coenzyme A thioesterase PaaI-like protein